MRIEVSKLTDVELLRKCASFTSGKDCNMSLRKAYANKHSIIRSQLFVVEMRGIPLFSATQFVRSTQGVNWFQRSKRVDRGGLNFKSECENIADRVGMLVETDLYSAKHIDLCHEIVNLPMIYDRLAPTDLLGIMNSEAIINMSDKRLCACASMETREIWEQVIHEISKVDPDLAKFCVRPCISHGGICRERCCGFNKTDLFKKQLEQYKLLFTNECK